MKLNAPTNKTVLVSIVLAALGIAVYGSHLIINRLIFHSLRMVPYLQPSAFLLVLVALVVLYWGVFKKGV